MREGEHLEMRSFTDPRPGGRNGEGPVALGPAIGMVLRPEEDLEALADSGVGVKSYDLATPMDTAERFKTNRSLEKSRLEVRQWSPKSAANAALHGKTPPC